MSAGPDYYSSGDCEKLIPLHTDIRKAGEISTVFKQRFLTKNSQEWFDILSRADVPVSRVNALDELADDPQVKHRQMILEVDTPEKGRVRQAGISIKLSDTPGNIRNAGAKPGENTKEILKVLGYSPVDIRQLQEENVI